LVIIVSISQNEKKSNAYMWPYAPDFTN